MRFVLSITFQIIRYLIVTQLKIFLFIIILNISSEVFSAAYDAEGAERAGAASSGKRLSKIDMEECEAEAAKYTEVHDEQTRSATLYAAGLVGMIAKTPEEESRILASLSWEDVMEILNEYDPTFFGYEPPYTDEEKNTVAIEYDKGAREILDTFPHFLHRGELTAVYESLMAPDMKPGELSMAIKDSLLALAKRVPQGRMMQLLWRYRQICNPHSVAIRGVAEPEDVDIVDLREKSGEIIFSMGWEYLRRQDFTRPKTLNFTALHSVLSDMEKVSGDQLWGQEDPLYHFGTRARTVQKEIITWHVNTAGIPRGFKVGLLPIIIAETSNLSRMTAYGCFGDIRYTPKLPFDLLYQLLTRGYVGTSQGYDQHIWLHRRLPISIRVKASGQYTIGILDKMPFDSEGNLDRTRLTAGAESEIFKVSGVHSIPARNPGFERPFFTHLWSGNPWSVIRELMAQAHFRIPHRYVNFDRATWELS